jgi:hypothetical protein
MSLIEPTKAPMSALPLLGIYCVLVGVGQVAGVLISLLLGTVYPTLAGVVGIAFIVGMLILPWPLAIKITELIYPQARKERLARA